MGGFSSSQTVNVITRGYLKMAIFSWRKQGVFPSLFPPTWNVETEAFRTSAVWKKLGALAWKSPKNLLQTDFFHHFGS
jgi:hypothetical protein